MLKNLCETIKRKQSLYASAAVVSGVDIKLFESSWENIIYRNRKNCSTTLCSHKIAYHHSMVGNPALHTAF